MLFYHLEVRLAVVVRADGDYLRVVGTAVDVDEALGDSEDAAVGVAGGSAEETGGGRYFLVHRG